MASTDFDLRQPRVQHSADTNSILLQKFTFSFVLVGKVRYGPLRFIGSGRILSYRSCLRAIAVKYPVTRVVQDSSSADAEQVAFKSKSLDLCSIYE